MSMSMRRSSKVDVVPANRTGHGGGPGGSVAHTRTGRKILTEEEQLQHDIKIHPELQSTLQGFDDFLNLLQAKKRDKGQIFEALSTNISKAFGTYSSDSIRGIMGNYLAVKGFAKRMYDLYEFAIGTMDILTCDFIHKHQDAIEVKLVMEMRKSLWTASDNSWSLGEKISQTGLFKYLLADVKAIGKTLPVISDDDLPFDTAVGIMYNCAQNHATRQKYRELDAVDILLPFLKAKSTKVKLTTLLVLTHIVDEAKNKVLSADVSVFDFLIDMIKKAWEDPHHRCIQGTTFFSARELLNGLTALAKNDDNKRLLMEKGVLKTLKTILKGGSEVEQEEAIGCIRELSFNDQNKSILNADEGVMDVLKEKEASGNAHIAKAAQFTRWGLATKKIQESNIRRRQSSMSMTAIPPKSGHVMLSYSWYNQKTVLEVYDRLKSEGFRLWIDIDDMAGSTLGAMANAVEKASAVILFVSESYFESQNCRQEAEYTYKLKKTMVPVLLQGGYQPTSWLGIILGTKLYFDMSPGKDFGAKLKELVRELGDNGRITEEEEKLQDVTDAASKPSMAVVARGGGGERVAGWTNKDVTEWLKNIGMYSSSPLRSLTGQELMFLQHLLNKAPEFYYSYLERNMKLKTLKDLMTFSNALTLL
ncbi:uncharacterized protein LOC124136687 [Haliotis rufescens]|uniref:uncharacterized protein LOC124136687 n=1 Tax=Haliotis rufescens TaxID=6454 RepID=UPI00201F4B8E|nr:uncharacterized protein LOC124136687 [Haliotis rufescens]XP_046358634.2 uncharacterized protein LOC124136687 [Haliotis rufescens]XP_048256661.1 uncharacterized protein LOC124136687 [Haliotis rufescens]